MTKRNEPYRSEKNKSVFTVLNQLMKGFVTLMMLGAMAGSSFQAYGVPCGNGVPEGPSNPALARSAKPFCVPSRRIPICYRMTWTGIGSDPRPQWVGEGSGGGCGVSSRISSSMGLMSGRSGKPKGGAGSSGGSGEAPNGGGGGGGSQKVYKYEQRGGAGGVGFDTYKITGTVMPDGSTNWHGSEKVDPNKHQNALAGGANLIDPYTGNATREIVDLKVYGGVGMHTLNLRRTSSTRLNNQTIWANPFFGRETGWTSNYSWFMRQVGNGPGGEAQLKICFPEGGEVGFLQQASDPNLWLPAASIGKRLYQDGDDFTVQDESGWQYFFEKRTYPWGSVYYRINGFEDPIGNEYIISYVGETVNIDRVTDPSGRYLEFTWAKTGEFIGNPTILANLVTPPSDQWIELNIPSNSQFQYFALRTVNNHLDYDPLPVAELEFVDDAGTGTLLTGTHFGSEPAFATGEEYDKAFDGNTLTYARYAHKRNGHLGIDLGAGNTANIDKVRVYIAPVSANGYARFEVIGSKENPNGDWVVTKVKSSDGREVNYNYTQFTDDSINFNYHLLTSVDYPDLTQATYEYEQVHPFTRPLLKHSIDPRMIGAGSNIEYGFDPNHVLGAVAEERNGATGDLIASIGAANVHTPQVIYPDGRVQEISYQTSNARAQNKTDGEGNVISFTHDQGGSGYLSSLTDALGNVTSYTNSEFGLSNVITKQDGSTMSFVRDALGRPLSLTETAIGEPNRVTSWTRDANGLVMQVTYPDGSTEQWTYNSYGKTLTHTQKNGGIESWIYDVSGLMTAYVDALGDQTTYTYNALDLPATETDPAGAVTAFEYNNAASITKITYADGGIVNNVYDDFQNLISTTDELGNTTSWTYDALKRTLSETDALGRVTSFDYGLGAQGCASCGSQSEPTQITYPDGRVVKKTLDNEWRVISQTDAFGDALEATVTTTYNAVGKVATQTDHNGNTTTFSYDNLNRLVGVTDALGQVTTNTLNGYGDIKSTTRPDATVVSNTFDAMSRVLSVTNAEGATTALSYDPSGNIASGTDALNRVTAFSYDLLDRRVGVTAADGSATSTGYDDVGNLISATNELGKVSTFGYDLMRRLVSATDATVRTATFDYPVASGLSGRQESMTTPSGKVSKTTYDAVYNIVSVTSGFGSAEASTVSYAYDNMDRVVSMTDPEGGISTVSYDLRGRTNSQADALGNTTAFGYDANSNLVSTTEADGVVTSNIFDALDRVTSTTDGENRTTSYSYGYDVRLLDYTDARGKIYSFTYDDDGLQVGRQFPDGTTTTSSYDAVDNLISFTKKDGVVQSNVYDVRNRLVQASWNDGTTPLTNISYDLVGRTIQVDHGGSIISRSFDDAGRLLAETQTIPAIATGTGNALALSLNYSYNTDGLLDSMTRPDGSVVQATYTGRNQIDQVLVGGAPPVVDYTYNLRGLLSGKTYESGGLTSAMNFDAVGRTLSVTNNSNAGVLDQSSYGYDTVNQRTYMQRVDGRGDLYDYDDARQMTITKLDIDSPSTGGIGVPVNDMSYSYDLGGNRSQTIDGGVATPYTANDINEYTLVGVDVPVYDDNGNLISGNGLSMAWDAHNRLMSVAPTIPLDGDLRAFYQYDGTGRRISKIVDLYDAGTTSWVAEEVRTFGYDGWNVIREGVVDTGGGAITETQTKQYTWGIDLGGGLQSSGGIGGLLMVEEDNNPTNAASPITAYYYTNDANGSVTAIVDNAGNLVAQYEYDPYGNMVASVGVYANKNPYRFSTKYSDSESGWSYFGYRYYDSLTGRWLSTDPIKEDGGLNLYAYVGNDPVNFWDPLGLDTMDTGLRASGYDAMGNPTDNTGGNYTLSEVIDGTQGTLDYAGLTPGVGIIPDAINALISLMRGNLGDAGMSTLAMVPGPIGWGGGGSKIVRKTITHCSKKRLASGEKGYKRAIKELGLDKHKASDALHDAKGKTGRGGADNVDFDLDTGDIIAPESGDIIGNLFD